MELRTGDPSRATWLTYKGSNQNMSEAPVPTVFPASVQSDYFHLSTFSGTNRQNVNTFHRNGNHRR